MNIRIAYAAALWAQLLSLPAAAANLQTRDIFFFSTHKRPTQIAGDSKAAYLLTESGVLVYDYGRQSWMDNLYPGTPVEAVRYSRSRSKLLIRVQGGRILEYNSAFRRFTDGSSEDFNAANDGAGSAADLTGLSMQDNYFYMGDAIRDKYMRKAQILDSRVFEYDNLWVLTDGLGPFYGSVRRKQAAPMWFGLYNPATIVIHADGGKMWFGSCQTDGALVQAKTDLNEWKVFPSGFEFGFGDGCVRDVASWKDYLWLATEKGVVRQDPRTGQFRAYTHFQGSTYTRIYALHVHQDQLCAGTEEGVSCLADPKEEFHSLENMPNGPGVPTYELESKDKDLWAATRYGLFVHRADGWKSLKEVSGRDVPESYGVVVPSVRYHDSTLYWIDGGKIMFKPKRQLPKVLFERDRPTRLLFDGDVLYCVFFSGVTAYDVGKNLWTDFNLQDGIPGNQVLCQAVFDGKLWIGTDLGVTRVNPRPYLP
jgi:ligand-binding sensor domain-containing protein